MSGTPAVVFWREFPPQAVSKIAAASINKMFFIDLYITNLFYFRKTYPAYFASKNKIELTPAIDVDKVLREMKSRYANEKVNDADGVKIDFPENWVHLRKSNTEPIIRVYTEAKTMAEADALARRIIAEMDLMRVMSQISLFL
jgi:phosphomannomutase